MTFSFSVSVVDKLIHPTIEDDETSLDHHLAAPEYFYSVQ